MEYYYDSLMVAAFSEINRRGNLKYVKNQFYPKLINKKIYSTMKETIIELSNEELFNIIKH